MCSLVARVTLSRRLREFLEYLVACGEVASLCDAEALLESTYCPTLFNSDVLHEALNHGSNLGIVVLGPLHGRNDSKVEP